MSEEKLSAPDPNQFHELTICSVSFGSAEYLMSNWRLAKALSGEGLKKWIVIENSPAACETRLTTSSSPFSVVEGTEFDSNHPTPASRHHGLALNKALGSVRTRFLLMMDPDFYIVRKHWIQCVLKHMDQQELAFFGVPWHPRWSNKYRYFPCPHCLFIDLERVGIDTLDFTPETRSVSNVPVRTVTDHTPSLLRRALRPLKHPLRLRQKRNFLRILSLAGRRSGIGVSRDTGYRLFRAFSRVPKLRFECAVPVFRPQSEVAPILTSWPNRLAERFLPDHLCYLPKQPGYFTSTGFHELGFHDVSSLDWEEFMWREAPFGFHLRQYWRPARELDESDLLKRVLHRFAHPKPVSAPGITPK